MMFSHALVTLQQVNANLHLALERFRPGQQLDAQATAAHFSGLLADLQRASECLRNIATQEAAGVQNNSLEQETRQYRKNLERLKQALPDLHARLLAERARLQNAQTHATVAASWAKASGETL